MARPRGSRRARQHEARLAKGKGKMIGYIRVSTKDQGEHGHSLDAQLQRLREVAAREGFDLVEVVSEVRSGAKEREALADVQRRVIAGEAEGIVFPKVDRLGRSLLHLLKIVDWAVHNQVDLLSADEGWQVRGGQKVDKMLPFRLAMAEVELERIRERTRDGLRAAREKGVRLGRPAENTGELAERAAAMRRDGMPLQEIADAFNQEGKTTARGRKFFPMTVYLMVNRVDPEANPVGGYQGKEEAVAG